MRSISRLRADGCSFSSGNKQGDTIDLSLADPQNKGSENLSGQGAKGRGEDYEKSHVIKPTLGFKSGKPAYATIKGSELMRALKKGQAKVCQNQLAIKGEIRLIERAFRLSDQQPDEARIENPSLVNGNCTPSTTKRLHPSHYPWQPILLVEH